MLRSAAPGHSVTRSALAALIVSALAAVMSVLSAAPAHAWAWSSTVKVWGTVSSCGVSSTGGWMYYQTDAGERGWANLYNGSGSFTFTLTKVPSSGSVVTLKWGISSCSAARYFVVSRPGWGDSASVGNLR